MWEITRTGITAKEFRSNADLLENNTQIKALVKEIDRLDQLMRYKTAMLNCFNERFITLISELDVIDQKIKNTNYILKSGKMVTPVQAGTDGFGYGKVEKMSVSRMSLEKEFSAFAASKGFSQCKGQGSR